MSTVNLSKSDEKVWGLTVVTDRDEMSQKTDQVHLLLTNEPLHGQPPPEGADVGVVALQDRAEYGVVPTLYPQTIETS